jgi:hypothetical protein
MTSRLARSTLPHPLTDLDFAHQMTTSEGDLPGLAVWLARKVAADPGAGSRKLPLPEPFDMILDTARL